MALLVSSRSMISIKTLHQFLNAFQQFPRDVLMSVAKDEVIVLFVSTEDTTLTCYIPLRAQ
jgi:hypothetical protein